MKKIGLIAVILAVICAMSLSLASCCCNSLPDILSELENYEEEKKGTEGLKYYPLTDGTYAVSVGDAKYLEEIVIPQKYNGKAVTVIAESGFFECTDLKNITIPESVTSIDDNAFDGCTSLENVKIPDSVTSIGARAFYIAKALLT